MILIDSLWADRLTFAGEVLEAAWGQAWCSAIKWCPQSQIHPPLSLWVQGGLGTINWSQKVKINNNTNKKNKKTSICVPLAFARCESFCPMLSPSYEKWWGDIPFPERPPVHKGNLTTSIFSTPFSSCVCFWPFHRAEALAPAYCRPWVKEHTQKKKLPRFLKLLAPLGLFCWLHAKVIALGAWAWWNNT